MRPVEDAVANRLGMVGVTNGGVPLLDGKLRRDERRAALGAFLDDFHEVASLGIVERVQEPIVDGEKVELGEPAHNPRVGAVTASDGKVADETRRTDIVAGEAPATSPLDEGACEKRLADPRRSSDEKVVSLGDPTAASKGEDLLAIQTAQRLEVYVLQRSRITKLGGFQTA